MWTCSKCREEVDDDFDVCWSCGTTREGVQNTDFNPDLEGIIGADAYRAQREAVQYEDLVTVATFADAPEAHMARSRLESQGITAFIMDELAGSTLGLFPARSGIRLQVAEKDAVRAHTLLAEVPHLQIEPDAEETDDSPGEEESDEYDDEDEDIEGEDEEDSEDSEEGIKK
jgi:hypothetical protein